MEYTKPRVRDHCAGKSVVLNTDHLQLMNDTVYPKEHLFGRSYFPTGRYEKCIACNSQRIENTDKALRMKVH